MQICLINRKYYHTSQSTNRQLRCRKWIGIVVQQCSYTPATEAVLPSIHYARSVISRSGAALRRYRQTLFKKDMEPRGEFFLEIIRPKSPLAEHRRTSPLGLPTRKHTCMIATQEATDNQAHETCWKGRKKGFCSRKRPCTHTHKKVRKTDIHESKKNYSGTQSCKQVS